jgi:hypothetical protein
MNTAPNQTAPWIMPGVYTINMIVSRVSQVYLQSFTIKMDPRAKTAISGLQQQHDLSLQCYEGRKECMRILDDIRSYRSNLKGQVSNSDEFNKKIKQYTLKLRHRAPGRKLYKVNGEFASIFNILQDSDAPPTTRFLPH